MLGNNNQRLNIVLGLKNVFDYNGFVLKCIESEIPALSIGEYAQKVGMLYVAKTTYPEMSDIEAYKTLIARMNNENNQVSSPQQMPVITRAGNCGNCGGGKVR